MLRKWLGRPIKTLDSLSDNQIWLVLPDNVFYANRETRQKLKAKGSCPIIIDPCIGLMNLEPYLALRFR